MDLDPPIDLIFLAYFQARIEQIETASMPRLARWTHTDITYMKWVLTARYGKKELPYPIEYLEALMDLWGALKPFLLEFSEYRHAGQLAAAVQSSWLWEALLTKADVLLELERELSTED